jgi:hypothetical protein
MSQLLVSRYVLVRSSAVWLGHRLRVDERGEGVISAAIAVLIMAFLGALMWVVFKDMFSSTTAKTKGQVDLIGQ